MEEIITGVNVVKFLLTSSSYGGEKVNNENIECFINNFIASIAYLYDIHKYIKDSSFNIIADHDIYNNDYFFSSTLTKKNIASHIKDEEALGLYLDMFTSHQDIITYYPIVGVGEGFTTCGETIEGFDYSIGLDGDNLGLISFSSNDKYNKSCFNVNGYGLFHVPPLIFNEDLSFLNNIRDFYVYFSERYDLIVNKEASFDYFDKYYLTYYFFEYDNNYHKVSEKLSQDLSARLTYHPIIGDFFATINGYKKDEKLSTKCSKGDVGRIIYNNKNKYISLDFQHLEFEKHQETGKHIGCIRMYKGDEGEKRIKKLTKHEKNHNLTF